MFSRDEVDPVYFNSPYYLYPDGQMAIEAIRVIGAAMSDADVVGMGRLTMSRHVQETQDIENRGLPLLKAFKGAILAPKSPESGECR